MEHQARTMKPIWYFVGMMLAAMGIIILITGLVEYSGVGTTRTVLSELHPALWWGAIMVIAGLLFFLANRKTKAE